MKKKTNSVIAIFMTDTTRNISTVAKENAYMGICSCKHSMVCGSTSRQYDTPCVFNCSPISLP